MPRPLRVAFVVFPGCMPAGLFATADLLRAANARSGATLFEVAWVSTSKAAVPVWGGQALHPTAPFHDRHDIYAVPGIWATAERSVIEILEQRPLIEHLRAVSARSAIWSYCAGVALVAAAQKLNGLGATATWWMQPLLEARFPKVRWRFSEQLVASRTHMTASGPHGYLALVNAQLERSLDADALRDVIELMMVPEPRSRHPLFRGLEVLSVEQPLRALFAHAMTTDAATLDLRGAAAAVGLSVRTLCRTVRRHTGSSAGEWLRRVKLKQAADDLIRSAKSVKQISLALGFSSEAAFHRTFRDTVGQTPLAFRRAYGERVASRT